MESGIKYLLVSCSLHGTYLVGRAYSPTFATCMWRPIEYGFSAFISGLGYPFSTLSRIGYGFCLDRGRFFSVLVWNKLGFQLAQKQCKFRLKVSKMGCIIQFRFSLR